MNPHLLIITIVNNNKNTNELILTLFNNLSLKIFIMTNLKKHLKQLPEYILIAYTIFYWLSAGIIVNPIAIVLIGILTLQIIFQNRITGILIPTIIIFVCFYMLLALISEVKEFPTFSSDAQQLLFIGLLFFILTMIISVVMLVKYASMEKRKTR